MANLAESGNASPANVERRERRFFMAMVVVIAVIVAIGFGAYAISGISSFDAPWRVHVHPAIASVN